MDDLDTRVRTILKDVGRTQTPLTLDAHRSLFDAGVLDSFGLPELVTALETEFGIKIPDRDLDAQTFESIERIAAYVQKHRR